MSKKSPSYRRLKVKGEARINWSALFLSTTPEKLGLTKSVYTRYVNQLKAGKELSEKAREKVTGRVSKSSLEFIETTSKKPAKVEISAKDAEHFAKDKAHKYVWVTVKGHENGKVFYTSFVTNKKSKRGLTKMTNDYIRLFIKQYGKRENPVILGVTAKLVGKKRG